MFKKILITIAVILIIAVIGLFIWALLISRQSGGEITVGESFQELISFGGVGDDFFTRRGTSIFDIDSSGRDGIKDDGDITLLRLRQLTNFPVAGATFVESEDGKTLIRFIVRENGHIFETTADSTTQNRISNTTILRIFDTNWLSGGDAFIARFLNEESSEIESFYAEIRQSETGGEGALDGVFLTKNIKELALSDKDKIFYLTPSGDGAVGIISDPDGDKKVQIFDSPLSEWNVGWPSGNKIALTTKASSDILGYLYFLDSKTEKIQKILSGVRGLTTLVNKDGTKVLFTQNEGKQLLLSTLDIEENSITDLSIWALSEKCVWSNIDGNIIYCGVPNIIPEGEDLDLWYQGLTTFSDSVWIIDIETQTADILANPIDIAGREIDLIKPVLSPNEDYLIFINKKDSTLWGLRLE
ncbi:MAG: hypothetical protein QGG63_01825 [Candidatus Pacebacteria bacterium]|jgi:hypothetical protein|nr:hypothetical protein [Candidatus Paceibacterota bacterium]|tara:strand:- start:10857 stop:12101 length:1245 start_codon:yes stop_codon:yes gene_type:complete